MRRQEAAAVVSTEGSVRAKEARRKWTQPKVRAQCRAAARCHLRRVALYARDVTELFLGDCIRRALCWALVRLAQVAIKFVSKDVAEEELDLPGWGRVPLEVAVMTLTNEGPECSNVLKLLDWFNQKSRYIMVLERLEPCQDLSAFCDDHGGRVGECFTRVVMKQLLNALIHCQRRGVLHRDVKPENVLINPDSLEIRLIDFGCGDLLQTSVYEYFSGTLQYAPPEWFRHRCYLAEPATVWSVGVLLFQMLCGYLPFRDIQGILPSQLRFPEGLSTECRHLIQWCLSVEAADRPALDQILLHPWFQ